MKELNSKFAKKKLADIVNLYKLLHKVEYGKFLKMMKIKKSYIKKDAKINSKLIKRALLEYPETLADMIEQGLDRQEYQWFRSIPGARYFSKIAPEFLLIDKI